jgi:hypothetical protein
MKVAVFIYGMYRDFDIAVKSWDFLTRVDNDVYFSTWNKSIQQNGRLGISVNEDVTRDRITKHIPTATISIESDILPLSNPQKMMYHWKQCLSMMESSGKEYDLVMLTRPDNFKVIEDYSFIEKCNVSGVVYGLDSLLYTEHGPFLQDIFFIGNTQTISNLIKTVPSDIHSIHNGLAAHILSLGYSVEKVQRIYMSTVRANARTLSEGELTLSNIFAKTIEWGDNQEQYLDSTEN